MEMKQKVMLILILLCTLAFFSIENFNTYPTSNENDSENNMGKEFSEENFNMPMDEDTKVKTAEEQDLYPEEFFFNVEEIPQGAEFTPTKVLVDPHDNIYISGSLYWANNGTNAMLLAKLDNKGIVLWKKIVIDPYDVHVPTDMVIGSDEHLYICAYAGANIDRIYLYKYNGSGDLEWFQTWDDGTTSIAEEMAIDEFDNLYIVGRVDRAGLSTEVGVIKYNAIGDHIWNVTYGGTDEEYGRDITISESGNIYVLGRTESFGIGPVNAWFFEIDSNGNMLWNKTIGLPYAEYPTEIAVDSLSNIYIQTVFNLGGNDKFDIFKFDSSGDYICNSSLSAPATGGAHRQEDMIIQNNFIYALQSGMIWKFNTSCTFLWKTDIICSRSFSLDSIDNLYVTTKFLYEDWFIMKLTSTPYITIDNPYENQIFTHQAPQFNLTILEPDIFGAWYSLDNGLTNFSINGTDGVIDQEEWESLNDGYITINFFANDTLGNIGQKDIIVFKDTEAPNIIVLKPIENSTYGTIPPNYSVLISGYNIEYGDDIDSCWYYIKELKETVNIYISGGIDNLNGTINPVLWGQAPEGFVNIEFGVKDVFGNEQYINIKLQKRLPREKPLDTIILTIYISTIVGAAAIAIAVLIIRQRIKSKV